MTMQFGKLIRKTYQNPAGTFHVYHLICHGGAFASAIYIGEDAPKPLKTVEYQLNGTWEDHPVHGRQFRIASYQKRPAPDHRGESKELVKNIKRLKE